MLLSRTHFVIMTTRNPGLKATAISFYKKLGFVEVAATEEDVDGTKVRLTVLERGLP